MAIRFDEYNGVCVVTVDGDLSGDAGAALRRAAGERIEQKRTVDFVVDLAKAGFVDSAGLESLLWLKRRCEEGFGKVKLAAAGENCRKILQITRLDQRLECHPDLPMALRTMRT
jgi:stage II sporulation protein AA (anti-sigma F factor antagonist)